MDLQSLIAQRVRQLRLDRQYSLDDLAGRSGVSRSSISLIERGQSSPSAVVLDKLATALGVVLASLFEPQAAAAPAPLTRRAGQAVWTDPASGYQRRQLSPATDSPLQLVEVLFPPGQRVALESAARETGLHQQIWVLEGCIHITLGDAPAWALEAGDCLAMRLNQPILFHNPTDQAARYLVAVVSLPAPRQP